VAKVPSRREQTWNCAKWPAPQSRWDSVVCRTWVDCGTRRFSHHSGENQETWESRTIQNWWSSKN